MYSPYVRRWRLATELRSLRDAAGMTHPQLGAAIKRPRQAISKLESGKWIPKQAELIKILEALNIDSASEKFDEVLAIARDAAEKGWWEDADGMGERQKVFADLEYGAVKINEYLQTFIPWALQTEDYQRARNKAEATLQQSNADPEKVLAGRVQRQRMLRRASGPVYEVIIDEAAIRRPSAPDPIMKDQLRHLVDSTENGTKISIRLLPATARVEGFTVPRVSYELYTYADPHDPQVAAIDTVTSDLIFLEEDQVRPYAELYRRLHAAALSPADSLEIIAQAADTLHDHE